MLFVRISCDSFYQMPLIWAVTDHYSTETFSSTPPYPIIRKALWLFYLTPFFSSFWVDKLYETYRERVWCLEFKSETRKMSGSYFYLCLRQNTCLEWPVTLFPYLAFASPPLPFPLLLYSPLPCLPLPSPSLPYAPFPLAFWEPSLFFFSPSFSLPNTQRTWQKKRSRKNPLLPHPNHPQLKPALRVCCDVSRKNNIGLWKINMMFTCCLVLSLLVNNSVHSTNIKPVCQSP